MAIIRIPRELLLVVALVTITAGCLRPASGIEETAAHETRSPATNVINERISPAGGNYIDPEFLQSENLVVFQDGADNSAWLGELDPKTGRFVSADGKDYLVDRDLAPLWQSFNGPEFGLNKNGWAVYYTKPTGRGKSSNQIWRARLSNGKFVSEPLTSGPSHQTAIAQRNPAAQTTRLFALEGGWRGGDAVWFDENAPSETHIFIPKRRAGTNAEYIPGTSRFITSMPDENDVRQLHVIDSASGQKTRISSDGRDKSGAWAWRAPEFNDAPAVVALEDGNSLGVWRLQQPGNWEKVTGMPMPDGSSMNYMKSPEPFAYRNRSYIAVGLHKDKYKGDGEIWIYPLDGGHAKRCDNGQPGVRRLEPEPFVTNDKAFIYYSVISDGDWALWLCEPELDTAVAATSPKPVKAAAPLVSAPGTLHQSLVLRDTDRDKDVRVRVTYPDKGRNLPVIVFSHGAWSSRDYYQPLIQHWASHGYVCVQMTHSDSREFGGKIGSSASFRDWQSRPRDVSFVIGSLQQIERQLPQLAGVMDRQRIGVSGHSFGGMTAQLVTGVKLTRMAAFMYGNFGDERVSAALLMSPPGRGQMLNDESWSELHLPLMTITGTRDASRREDKGYAWRKDAYELSPPGDKYLIVLDGGDHGLGGITGEEDLYDWKVNRDQARIVLNASLAFWDAYLKNDPQPLKRIASSPVIRLGDARAEISSK